MASAAVTSVCPTAEDVFAQVEQYPWDVDEEFHGGLSAILGPDPTPDQASALTLRARCFYYSRKFNTSVDFDGYKAWRQAKHLPPPSLRFNGTVAASAEDPLLQTSAEPPAPEAPRFSYQDIVEMIQTGKPVPGIKEIPNTVLEGQGTQATRTVRRKPWEKDVSSEPAPQSEVRSES
ncbi:hypothetical protein EJ06DRAFT_533276 [Trichodelitschia bisporula]|uniref:Uncharacterized protein n=1 Tax=Trichodelitschia bisporula TaxID=703511 RepID=A0A6G1HMV1_9PEZI|nr:hypothetical protein EJ06DRAFT_533276 [Trichodelitschia bisporula]